MFFQCERPLPRDGGESNYFRPIQGAQSMLTNPESSFDMRIAENRPNNSDSTQIVPIRNQKISVDSDVNEEARVSTPYLRLSK